MADSSTRQLPDHSGVWVPPPLLYVGFFTFGLLLQGVLPLDARRSSLGWVGGGLLIAAGVLLTVWSLGLFRVRRTSPIPVRPTTALVLDGPYRFSRNPMYVGLLLVYVGFALALRLVWVLLLVPVLMLVVDQIVIRKEEAYLERKFGADFMRYKDQVRRWL